MIIRSTAHMKNQGSSDNIACPTPAGIDHDRNQVINSVQGKSFVRV